MNNLKNNHARISQKGILLIVLFFLVIALIIYTVLFKDVLLYDADVMLIDENDFTKASTAFSSHLPVIEIEYSSRRIDDRYNPASGTMRVFDNGSDKIENTLHDMPAYKYLNITFHVRGNSSFGFNKKSYHVEFFNNYNLKSLNAPILGLPASSDFILYSSYTDKSLMRDWIAYDLGAKILKQWTPKVVPVELWLRSKDTKLANNNYQGIFFIMEKIKVEKNRVDLKPFTMAEDPLKWFEDGGGYIVLRDHINDQNKMQVFRTNSEEMLIYYPKAKDMTPEIMEYITDEYQHFEDMLHYTKNYSEKNGGISKYFDMDSFVDTYIIQEFMQSVDGGRLSFYMYRDIGKKLVCGPIWDFNLAAGNADYNDCDRFDTWVVYHTPTYRALFDRKAFVDAVIKRWEILRKNELSDENIKKMIDEKKEILKPATKRNFDRWPELFDGKSYIWPNPYPYTTSWNQEVTNLKQYLLQRAAWMDKHFKDLYKNAKNINQ